MATLGDITVHLTGEPTEAVRAMIRAEVYKVLKETFEEQSWLSELVRTEVQKALEQVSRSIRMQGGASRI